VATTLYLKGSLFDEELLGMLEVPAVPEVGDVVEHAGKSLTITDLIRDDGLAHSKEDPAPAALIAVVEPFAVSQRRHSRMPPPA
jgi:hypothetical protein